MRALSSTQTPSVHLFSTENPLVQHQKPLSSALSQFHTKNPWVQNQNPLCSTPPPQFHTENPSVQHTPQTKTVRGTEGFLVWKWGLFGVELIFWIEGGIDWIIIKNLLTGIKIS